MFRYLPEQSSDFAHKVDFLNNIITDISVFFTVVIVGAMIYFAIRYRRRGGVDHETPAIHGSNFLEIVWTAVPTIICIFIAAYGVIVFREMRDVGENPLEIRVWGQKWKWDFATTREDGTEKLTTKEFVVPVDKNIKMVMQSRDVLHSFFIPNMRVKADVIPNRYTYVTFTPIKTGEYNVFCTEYCGEMHWNMLAKMRVVSQAEYDVWLADKSDEIAKARMTPLVLGKKLFTEKACNTCHSLDGKPGIGPSFMGLYGKQGESDKGAYTADENYLQESILNSNEKIVVGYPGAMPAFEGQLTSEEVEGLIAFIKSVKDGPPAGAVEEEEEAEVEDLSALSPVERGEALYKTAVPACMACHSIDGSTLVGPSFKGLYGKSGKLADGKDYEANDDYIRKSIREPAAEVVEGFAPAMAPYSAEALSDEQINDIIEYLKTVK